MFSSGSSGKNASSLMPPPPEAAAPTLEERPPRAGRSGRLARSAALRRAPSVARPRRTRSTRRPVSRAPQEAPKPPAVHDRRPVSPGPTSHCSWNPSRRRLVSGCPIVHGCAPCHPPGARVPSRSITPERRLVLPSTKKAGIDTRIRWHAYHRLASGARLEAWRSLAPRDNDVTLVYAYPRVI